MEVDTHEKIYLSQGFMFGMHLSTNTVNDARNFSLFKYRKNFKLGTTWINVVQDIPRSIHVNEKEKY